MKFNKLFYKIFSFYEFNYLISISSAYSENLIFITCDDFSIEIFCRNKKYIDIKLVRNKLNYELITKEELFQIFKSLQANSSYI